MKKQSHTKVIHIWNDYDFTLYIPADLKGFNKPHISFNYKNENTGKKERIKKFIRKHKGDLKKINLEAKEVALDLVKLLENHWNPISKSFGEVTVSPLAPVKVCIEYYLQAQTKSFENQAIGFNSLKNTKILMMHFSDYLRKKNLLLTRLESFTNIHIKEFLDSKGFEKGWGKVTYNTYLVNLGTFFNYFKDLKFLFENPCTRVSKKNIKFDTSRFKVFEKEELHNVATLLVSDKTHSGLYLATKLLYKYDIRPIEITRIQIRNIDFNKELLTLDGSKTKNQNEARFKLDRETLELIKDMRATLNHNKIDQIVYAKALPLQYDNIETVHEVWQSCNRKTEAAKFGLRKIKQSRRSDEAINRDVMAEFKKFNENPDLYQFGKAERDIQKLKDKHSVLYQTYMIFGPEEVERLNYNNDKMKAALVEQSNKNQEAQLRLMVAERINIGEYTKKEIKNILQIIYDTLEIKKLDGKRKVAKAEDLKDLGMFQIDLFKGESDKGTRIDKFRIVRELYKIKQAA